MKKTFSYTTNGSTMQMELNLAYYEHNRTLAVALFEQCMTGMKDTGC